MRRRAPLRAIACGAMPLWRRKALEYLPHHRLLIEQADSLGAVWVELSVMLRVEEEVDERLLSGIEHFMNWCFTAPRVPAGYCPASIVTVALLEHLPCHSLGRDLMRRWFSREEARQMRQTFEYIVGREAFEQILSTLEPRRSRRA